MQSSRWDAQGNIYLVTEEPLTPERVRSEVGDADGILEVVSEVRTSRSRSGTPTARVRRCPATARASPPAGVLRGEAQIRSRCVSETGLSMPGCWARLVEQDLGEVIVGELEEVDGVHIVAVDVGNPHAVVEGDPATLLEVGPRLETNVRFPNRTNVQVARRAGDSLIEARVWERGVGETASSGTSAVAVAAALGMRPAVVRFPGGRLWVHFRGRRAFLIGSAARVDSRAVSRASFPTRLLT